MVWQYNPYVWFPMAEIVVSAGLLAYVWRRRSRAGVRQPHETPSAAAERLFAVSMAIGLLWSLGYALQLSSANLEAAFFWLCAQMVPAALLPVLWLIITLHYTDHKRWTGPYGVAGLLLIPGITLALLYFGRIPGPMVRETYMIPLGTYAVIRVVAGPWFAVHVAYTYGLIVAIFVLLALKTARMPRAYRGRPLLLMTGLLLLLLANPLYMLFLADRTPLNLTTLIGTLAHLAAAWVIFRYRLYRIVPVARAQLIESMPDALFVLDREGQLVELNPAAGRVLGITLSRAMGHGLEELPQGEQLARILDREGPGELHLERDGGHTFFEVHASALAIHGRPIGWLVTLREVTERKRVEAEREELIAELRAALDEVQVLSELLPICAWCGKVRDDAGYWQRLDHYLTSRSGTTFTHGICPECLARVSEDLPADAPQADVGPADAGT